METMIPLFFILFIGLLFLIRMSIKDRLYLSFYLTAFSLITFSPLFYSVLFGAYPFPDYAYWTSSLFHAEQVVTIHVFKTYASVLCGLLSGYFFCRFRNLKSIKARVVSGIQLTKESRYIVFLIVLLLAGVVFFYGFGGSTILTATYSTRGFSGNQNYLILLQFTVLGLLVLGFFSTQKVVQLQYRFLVIVMLCVWVILVDLLQGDRTSIGALLGALYVGTVAHWAFGAKHSYALTQRAQMLCLLLIAIAATLLSFVRAIGILNSIPELTLLIGRAITEFSISGPWIGGFRQLVGQGAEEDSGLMISEILWSHLLIAVPGDLRLMFGLNLRESGIFDTDLYGVYTSGGTHPAVLYYEIFGYPAIFFIFFFKAYLVAKYEIMFIQRLTPFRLFILSSFIAILPRYVWYGHSYLVKYLSILMVIYFVVMIVTRISSVRRAVRVST